MSTLPTDPYKGVRDFYPEERAVQNYIFSVMREVAKKYGYEEYDASLLEPTELYTRKGSDEIINEQSYTFTDRGDRSVTLRPEMTPTAARMVAARHRELNFPLRWFSIPNVFRYERPQRGRLREHWQLNVDIFGTKSIYADLELLLIATDIMRAFGAQGSDYEIRVSHRGILEAVLRDELGLDDETEAAVRRIIDKKDKMPREKYESALAELVPNSTDLLMHFLETPDFAHIKKDFSQKIQDSMAVKECEELLARAREHGITNARYDPSLVRGFDYYTGLVFEVFDTNKNNNRSLFGGGRYDRLTDLFGVPDIPALGFGMGDVTIHDFLTARELIPSYAPNACLYICVVEPEYRSEAFQLAGTLRNNNIRVTVDLSEKKVGEQIRLASKLGIPYIVCLGQKEVEEKTYTIKTLASSEEKEVSLEKLITLLSETA